MMKTAAVSTLVGKWRKEALAHFLAANGDQENPEVARSRALGEAMTVCAQELEDANKGDD